MASPELASLAFSVRKIESDPTANMVAQIMHGLGKLVLAEQPKGTRHENSVWPPLPEDDLEDSPRPVREIRVHDSWPEGVPRSREVHVDLDDRSTEVRYTLYGDESTLSVAVRGEVANQTPGQILAGLVMSTSALFAEVQESQRTE